MPEPTTAIHAEGALGLGEFHGHHVYDVGEDPGESRNQYVRLGLASPTGYPADQKSKGAT
jgi:hypothetical protein